MRVCATQLSPLLTKDVYFKPRNGGVEIRVVENDRRGFAAQLQAHALEAVHPRSTRCGGRQRSSR